MKEFTRRYLESAIWSSTVLLPVPEDELVDVDIYGKCMNVDEEHQLYGISECDFLDDHFTVEDFDKESLEKAEKDCDDFLYVIKSYGLYEKALEYADDDRIAHDFWLTRNGHGAGFWDGDYGDSLGKTLTNISKEFSEINILVDNDGTLFFA